MKEITKEYTIKTPEGKTLTLTHIKYKFIKQVLGENEEFVAEKQVLRRNKSSYLLKDGRVVFQSLIFQNEEDFYKCYQPDKYYTFHIAFYNGDYSKPYFKFMVFNEVSKELFATKKYKILPEFVSPSGGLTAQFEDDTYLFFYPPDRGGFAHWTESFLYFKRYYEDLHYEVKKQSFEVEKILIIPDYETTLKITKIDAEKASKYIKNTPLTIYPNPHYSQVDTTVYHLKNGKAVWTRSMPEYDSDYFLIFNNQEEMRLFFNAGKIIEAEYNFSEHEHNKAVFKQCLNDPVKAIAEVIEIDEKSLDFTAESIKALDSQLSQYYMHSYLRQKLLPRVTAYFGEVLRKEIGGEWKITDDKHSIGWRPTLQLESGKKLDFYPDIVDQLLEQESQPQCCLECIYIALRMS